MDNGPDCKSAAGFDLGGSSPPSPTRQDKQRLIRILTDPVLRKELFVGCIIATQAREGIVTTREQAEAAYDKIQKEKRCKRNF
jgi:hypothetical protein